MQRAAGVLNAHASLITKLSSNERLDIGRRSVLPCTRRLFATPATSTRSAAVHHQETLALLEKTVVVASSVLGNSTAVHERPLRALLTRGQYESFTQAKNAQVVLYNIDKDPLSDEIISILLEDPFASWADVFRHRWAGKENANLLKYRYAPVASQTKNGLEIPSSWLRRFSIDLHELGRKRGDEDFADHSEDYARLHNADVRILVANPLSNSMLELLHLLPDSPNSILVLPSMQFDVATKERILDSQLLDMETVRTHKTQILFVDPSVAARGLAALREGRNSVEAVQRYQDYWSVSGFTELSGAISTILSKPATELRKETFQSAARSELLLCRGFLQDTLAIWAVHQERFVALVQCCEEQCSLFQKEILRQNPVKRAQEKMEKEKGANGEKMSFWSLPFIVDDLSTFTSGILCRSWTAELEQEMRFQAGKLKGLQFGLTQQILDFVQTLHPTLPSLDTPSLKKSIAELITLPANAITSNTLVSPIHTRLSQLSHIKLRLQVNAQHVLFSFMGLTFASVGGASSAWAGLLGPWAEINGMTAIGTGALASLVGLRLAISSWERTKRKAWDDWRRIGEALERDVEMTVRNTIREKAGVALIEAQAKIGPLVVEQLAEMERLQRQTDGLLAELGVGQREEETKGRRRRVGVYLEDVGATVVTDRPPNMSPA